MKRRKILCKHIGQIMPPWQRKVLFCIASLDEGSVSVRHIADFLKGKYTTVHYHVTKLKMYGCLNEYNELTARGKKILRYFKHWDKTFQKKLRAHKIQVVFYLSRGPKDLKSIKNYILEPITNQRYEGLKTELAGCSVSFYCWKKAVVMLPEILGNNDEEILGAIMDFAGQLKDLMEMEFEGLKIKEYQIAKFTSMHVAILDSIIAEQFILRNKCCASFGRVKIDQSHGRHELESEDPEHALDDIEILVRYEDLARENERLKKEIESLK